MDITEFLLSHRERAFLVGDHGSYRAQLSHQLATLRRKLGLATGKNAKYAPKVVTPEEIGSNYEFAHLILLTAERAWAHAMHMKTSQAEDSASQKFPGATRSHIVSRLVKASKQADILVSLLRNSASKSTNIDVLEAQAYASYLSGLAEFEKLTASPKLADTAQQREKWQDCLQAFSVARVSYAALSKKTKKDCFKDILTNEVDPGIRVAAYQSQIPRTVAIVEVARRCFPQDQTELVETLTAVDDSALKAEGSADGNDQNYPKTIQWRSRTAKIVDASIGQALYAVSQAEETLTKFLSSSDSISPKQKAAAYDEILIASQDAVDTARHVIEEHEREKIPESDSRMQDLRVTNLAVNYDMIGWRVGRNRVLIGSHDGFGLDAESPKIKQKKDEKKNLPVIEGRGRKLARLRERVVLYDQILQSIDSVKDIRGAVRDAGFVEELDGHRAYFQALKCVNIAYSHSLHSNFANSLALLHRASELAKTAAKGVSKSGKSESTTLLKLSVDHTMLSTLDGGLWHLTVQNQAQVELQKANSAGEQHGVKPAPLIERLDSYPEGKVDLKNLVTYPPRLEPVPVKPLFLDVAWNYIEYPGGSSSIATKSKPQETDDKKDAAAAAKRGWFGFGGR